MFCTATYLSCKPDPWRSSGCILTPHAEVLVDAAPLFAPASVHDPQVVLVETVTNVFQAVAASGAKVVMLILTVVHNRLVVVSGTDLVLGTGELHETGLLLYSDCGNHFQRAYQLLVSGSECSSLQVFAAYCPDVSVGSASYPVVFPAGPGLTIHHRTHVSVRVRNWVSPLPGFVPIVDMNGWILKCVPASLSPLFHHVYIAIATASGTLTTDMENELLEVVQSLESMSRAGFSTARPVVFTTDALALESSHFLSCADPPSLLSESTGVLRSLCHAPSLAEWVAQTEAQVAQGAHVSLVCAGYWLAKVRHLTLGVRCQAEAGEVVQRYRAALPHMTHLVSEMEGLVFDVLLQGVTLDAVPCYFHPSTFCDDVQGAGYLTMLYLLQWRQTLQRFIEVAQERSLELTELCPDLLPSLAHFRAGVIVQGAHCTPIKSVHRFLPAAAGTRAQHSFLINLSGHDVLNMHSKSTLQQQRAEDRNVVVAFFIGQALQLLAPLLCPSNCSHASSVLTEGYFAALKPKSLTNLAKMYERMQSVARKFRQEVCALKQLQHVRSNRKRKGDE